MSKSLKLNQVISIENQVRTRTKAELTEIHKANQKPGSFNGHARKFEPRDDDPNSATGERLPDENQNIQAYVQDILNKSAEKWARAFDIVAMRDWGNQKARCSVEVDGKVLIEDAPVTYLLYLEKQLQDVHTFAMSLPVLDQSEKWAEHDNQQKVFVTDRSGQARNKPITRAMVLYPHSEQHPAQVKEVQENVFAGTWWTTKYSAAIPAQRKAEILARVVKLQEAVKFARERANEVDVEDKRIGHAVFSHLFA